MDISRDGAYSLLAIDHRSSLKSMINPEKPGSVQAKEMMDLKRDIVRTLSPLASATILDPASALACRRAGALPKGSRLAIALEKSGYESEGGERITMLSLFPAAAMKRGADAAKLQVHYNPRFLSSAEKQVALAREVKSQCEAIRLPLILQVHLYDVQREAREHAMANAAETFAPHCDLLSAEFPASVILQEDAISACKRFTRRMGNTPWILSSYGDDYLSFQLKLDAACRGGALGFSAGMALWKEAAGMRRSERDRFLNVVATGRLIRLDSIVRRARE